MASLAASAGATLPGPAHGGSLDALDPFDPVSSDPWRGPLVPTALYAPAEAPTRGRGPWLGLGGGLQSSPGERRRLFALVELGIPLDALAGAPRVAAGVPEADAALTFPGSAVPDPAVSDAALTVPGSAVPDAARPVFAELGIATSPHDAPLSGATGLPPGAVDRRSEAPPLPGCDSARSCDPAALMPLARVLVAEALRVGGGQAELRRLDAMAARSRAAAGLPEVRLGAGTSRDESLRLAPTAADPARFTRDGGRDLWLEARLTWRLDSAIFARDEIAIMRLRAQQRGELARLAREVLEALVTYERARLRVASELSTSDERDQARVAQFGALARLDVLTDGGFSRRLARRVSSAGDGASRGTHTPAEGWR